MQIKRYVFWSILSVFLSLLLSGCVNVKGSQSVVEASSTTVFNGKKIAILPAKMQASLSPDSVMAMRTEVNKALAPTVRAKIPTSSIMDVGDVVNHLNQSNHLTNFEQLMSCYEATGVMDKRHVAALGTTLGCDFLLVTYLKSEKLDVGFISKGAGASLDAMLIDIRTSEISWAGSGEWKKGGIFGKGGAPFSVIANNIVDSAFKSLQSSGANAPIASYTPPVMQTEEPVASPKTNSERRQFSRKVIVQAQQQLLELGYEPGPVDGKMGKGTASALKKFQNEYNIPETGQPDPETVKMLEKIGGSDSL